jgi:hypothetical protein
MAVLLSDIGAEVKFRQSFFTRGPVSDRWQPDLSLGRIEMPSVQEKKHQPINNSNPCPIRKPYRESFMAALVQHGKSKTRCGDISSSFSLVLFYKLSRKLFRSRYLRTTLLSS